MAVSFGAFANRRRQLLGQGWLLFHLVHLWRPVVCVGIRLCWGLLLTALDPCRPPFACGGSPSARDRKVQKCRK